MMYESYVLTSSLLNIKDFLQFFKERDGYEMIYYIGLIKKEAPSRMQEIKNTPQLDTKNAKWGQDIDYKKAPLANVIRTIAYGDADGGYIDISSQDGYQCLRNAILSLPYVKIKMTELESQGTPHPQWARIKNL